MFLPELCLIAKRITRGCNHQMYLTSSYQAIIYFTKTELNPKYLIFVCYHSLNNMTLGDALNDNVNPKVAETKIRSLQILLSSHTFGYNSLN